jgi:carboxymethylenebutenolidase
MGELIQYPRPDGKKVPGYLVEPQQKTAPGIVLLQEWWGVNDHIKDIAGRLAKAGFRVLAPDLFRGKVTKDSRVAGQMMGSLNPDEARQDIAGAVDFLKAGSSKVGVMGFCMGGALTIAAAVNVNSISAAVCFYGIPPADQANPKKIRVSIQFHFANSDQWCSPSAVAGLEDTVKSAKVNYEMYRYDADHAFFNDTRPEVYNEACATLAWDRALKFLKENL